MEIKDVNNPLAQLMFGKNGSVPAASGDAATKGGFASLLGNASAAVEDLMSSLAATKDGGQTSVAKPAVKDAAPAKPAKKEKPAAKDVATDKSAENTDKAEKPAKRKDKEVADAAPQQAEKPVERKTSKSEQSAAEVIEDVAAPAEGASLVEAVEQNTSAYSQKLQSILEIADQMGFVAVSNNGKIMLVPSEQLQSMDPSQMVQIFDVAKGEVVEMSVADLLAKTHSQDASLSVVPGEEFVADLDIADFAQKLAQTPLAQEPEGEVLVRDFTAKVVQYTDADLAAQAAKLDEKLAGSGINVVVEVEKDVVGEEKIAHSTRDLLATDSADLQDFLEAVKTPITKLAEKQQKENEVDATRSEAPQDPAAVSQAQVANPAPVMPAGTSLKAAAIAPQMLDETDLAVKAVALENNSALNNAAAASQALKPELAAKAEEMSLKDVYKGMAKEAVEQVKVNITKSAVAGVDKIDVRLKPDDLGQVHIKMQISKDGKLQAEIIASRQETMQVLQKEVETLQKAFNDAGFDTDSGSFSFSFRGEEEQNQNSELRSFIGNILEKESGEELVSNDNLTWDPAQGLNIRV